MFVTFEGPEGAGKSTVVQALADRLRQVGKEVVTTREPGYGPTGERIRSILLSGERISDRCELFLFLADRAQHVEELVGPALADGKTVICDRFSDSTVVYQGYARGHDLSMLRAWNTFATRGLTPDLTLLLDLDVAVGLARIQDKDRLDREPLEFHQRVRQGFLAEARLSPARWVVVNAEQPLEAVTEECWRALRPSLGA